ncbi:MAG: hypothetical protein KGI06_00950 [Candidatus Micrarchaeota archaeon]|nr:hypothetical protein [Candidatus Micrarchaeota archaeon]
MDVKYSDLLKIVEEVESGSEKTEFNTIDISKIKSSKIQRTSKPPFKPLLSLAIGMESGHAPARPAGAQQQARPKQAPPPKQQASMPIQPAEQKSQVSEVKKEIGSFANMLSGNESRDSPSSYQLSELSVQDQISEINRIIESARKHTLDQEQMQVMKMGLYSLDRQLMEQKQQGKMDRSAQNMAKIRDKRLSEAIELLSDGK